MSISCITRKWCTEFLEIRPRKTTHNYLQDPSFVRGWKIAGEGTPYSRGCPKVLMVKLWLNEWCFNHLIFQVIWTTPIWSVFDQISSSVPHLSPVHHQLHSDWSQAQWFRKKMIRMHPRGTWGLFLQMLFLRIPKRRRNAQPWFRWCFWNDDQKEKGKGTYRTRTNTEVHAELQTWPIDWCISLKSNRKLMCWKPGFDFSLKLLSKFIYFSMYLHLSINENTYVNMIRSVDSLRSLTDNNLIWPVTVIKGN